MKVYAVLRFDDINWTDYTEKVFATRSLAEEYIKACNLRDGNTDDEYSIKESTVSTTPEKVPENICVYGTLTVNGDHIEKEYTDIQWGTEFDTTMGTYPKDMELDGEFRFVPITKYGVDFYGYIPVPNVNLMDKGVIVRALENIVFAAYKEKVKSIESK